MQCWAVSTRFGAINVPVHTPPLSAAMPMIDVDVESWTPPLIS